MIEFSCQKSRFEFKIGLINLKKISKCFSHFKIYQKVDFLDIGGLKYFLSKPLEKFSK